MITSHLESEVRVWRNRGFNTVRKKIWTKTNDKLATSLFILNNENNERKI